MSNRFLVEHFARWRQRGESMVLATVIETEGSTYSKAGRQLLINAQHHYAGLVGGGCLEGDLVLRADEVLATGQPTLLTYDMRDDADDLWGMGLGCRGLMRLLLQPLQPTNDWQPFTALATAMRANSPSDITLVVSSDDPARPLGQLSIAATTASQRTPALQAHNGDTGACTTLRWTVEPWPRVLVLGAGPDAGPVVALLRALGWAVTVADHRPELLQAAALEAADDRVHVAPAQLADQLPLADFTAVCVMSHHLGTDCAYLRALCTLEPAYIGVLGPATRKQTLLDRLGLTDTPFAGRLHGPVGLAIGADTPQSIALALVAEIHAAIKSQQA